MQAAIWDKLARSTRLHLLCSQHLQLCTLRLKGGKQLALLPQLGQQGGPALRGGRVERPSGRGAQPGLYGSIAGPPRFKIAGSCQRACRLQLGVQRHQACVCGGWAGGREVGRRASAAAAGG